MPKTDAERLSAEYKRRRLLIQRLTTMVNDLEQTGDGAAGRGDWIEAHAAYAQTVIVQQIWDEAFARSAPTRQNALARREDLCRRLDQAHRMLGRTAAAPEP